MIYLLPSICRHELIIATINHPPQQLLERGDRSSLQTYVDTVQRCTTIIVLYHTYAMYAKKFNSLQLVKNSSDIEAILLIIIAILYHPSFTDMDYSKVPFVWLYV